MLKDSILIDRKSFKTFDKQLKYAENHIKNLYDDHDRDEFLKDKSLWTEDLMNQEMVNVVNNFSKERIKFLKKIVNHIYNK
jgi:hypothetical protein